MRIIFMGTPEFAVPSLQALIEKEFNVVAVITATDKPAGRGNKLITSAVKDCALKYQIPVLQPEKLKSPEFLEELRSYQADLQIVVAFRMLPEVVWNMPKYGTFNLHASLLPQYRGAAPINWAIIEGETETGLTTFFLEHEIDTGKIIFQEREAILPEDDFGALYAKLMQKGGDLVVKTVQAIIDGNYPQVPQDNTQPIKLAPKIFKETCAIDWSKSTVEIHNFVRGLSPIPAAWTTLLGKNCKIFKTKLDTSFQPENTQKGASDGLTYLTDNKKFLYLQTSDGYLSVEELQLEGKKRMDIRSFLAGNKMEVLK